MNGRQAEQSLETLGHWQVVQIILSLYIRQFRWQHDRKFHKSLSSTIARGSRMFSGRRELVCILQQKATMKVPVDSPFFTLFTAGVFIKRELELGCWLS